jgi:hypothetical protein
MLLVLVKILENCAALIMLEKHTIGTKNAAQRIVRRSPLLSRWCTNDVFDSRHVRLSVYDPDAKVAPELGSQT